jgi:hypothetical protein
MATALDIISRAMRLAGVYSLGEAPTADEAVSGLYALNSMLGSWANSNLLINAETLDQITISASTTVYTLGPTGTVVTTRPQEVLDNAYIVYQGVSYPCPLVALSQYNDIPYKGQTNVYPWGFKYEATYPNLTVTVYPTPTDTSQLNLWSMKPLTSFAALTTQVNLPPGYEEALAFNLAVNYGAEFDGASIPASVVQNAVNTKRMLVKANRKPLILNMPRIVLPVNGYVDWRAGA